MQGQVFMLFPAVGHRYAPDRESGQRIHVRSDSLITLPTAHESNEVVGTIEYH
jgi:hypothetical protein